jgi:hypothetical protein
MTQSKQYLFISNLLLVDIYALILLLVFGTAFDT